MHAENAFDVLKGDRLAVFRPFEIAHDEGIGKLAGIAMNVFAGPIRGVDVRRSCINLIAWLGVGTGKVLGLQLFVGSRIDVVHETFLATLGLP